MKFPSTLRWMPLFALALSVAGCGTTGDPRQGGLFGWSEDQANARQVALRQAEANAHQQAAAEQRRTDALRSQQAGLSAEAMRLKAELDRLLHENQKLDAQLRDTMQRRRVGWDEAARLRKILSDNESLRSASRETSAAGGAPSPIQVDAVNVQNNRLHRELMILLQR